MSQQLETRPLPYDSYVVLAEGADTILIRMVVAHAFRMIQFAMDLQTTLLDVPTWQFKTY